MPIKPQDKARILAEAGVDPKKYWMDDNGEIIDMPEQGPAETAIKTTLHNAPRTALGFVGSALGATGAGALATPETAGLATIPAALAGGAAGGAAGGFAGQALQEAVYPESWRLAQEARSVRAPITTKVADIGASMALMRPSATVFKAAARAPGEFMRTAGQLQPKTVEALANVGFGAGMSGGMAAAQGASPSEVALETALGALQVQPTWLGTKMSGGLFKPFTIEGLAQPGGLPTAEAQARFASALEAQNAPPQPTIAPDVLAELAKKFAKQQAADTKRIQEGVIAGEGARQNEAQRQKRAVVEAVMGVQPEDSKTVLPADIRSVDERLAATGGAPEQQMKLTPAAQQAQEAKLRGASPVEQELAMLLSPEQHKYFRDVFKKFDTEYGDLPENAASGRFTPRKSASEPSRTDISSRAYIDVYPHEALHALLSDTLNYGTARERAFTERALRELGIEVLTDANGRKSLAEGSEEALAKQVGEESVRVLAGKQKPAPVREAFSDFVDYLINDKLTPDVARRILRDRTVFGAGTRGIVARAARRGGMQAAAGMPPVLPEAVEQQPAARTPPSAAQAEAMQAQRRADELAARAEQMKTLLDEQEARLRRLESAERTRQRISALPESPLGLQRRRAALAEERGVSMREFETTRPSLRSEEGESALSQAERDYADRVRAETEALQRIRDEMAQQAGERTMRDEEGAGLLTQEERDYVDAQRYADTGGEIPMSPEAIGEDFLPPTLRALPAEDPRVMEARQRAFENAQDEIANPPAPRPPGSVRRGAERAARRAEREALRSARESTTAMQSAREAAARGERIGPDTDVTRPETVEYTGAPVPANVRAGVRQREAMLETPADLEARRIEEQLSGRDRGRDRYQPLLDEETRARNLEAWRQGAPPRRAFHGGTFPAAGAFRLGDGGFGKGIYLSSSRDVAENYSKFQGGYEPIEGGRVDEYEIRLRNPLIVKTDTTPYVAPHIAVFEALGMPRDKARAKAEKLLEDKGALGGSVKAMAQKQGYDGIIHENQDGTTEYVLFDSNQAKLVEGNTGEYSFSKDVRYQPLAEERPVFATQFQKELDSPNPLGAMPGKDGRIPANNLRTGLARLNTVERELLANAGLEQFLRNTPRPTAEELKKWADEKLPKIEIRPQMAISADFTAIEQELALLQHDWYENLNIDRRRLVNEAYDTGNVDNPEILSNFTQEERAKMDRFFELNRELARPNYLRKNVPDSATARYAYVNPRGLKDMPGAVDILVKMPGSEQQVAISHYPREGKDLVTHVRAYEHTLPDGTKALRVFELQSDWGQERRKFDKEWPIIESLDKLPEGWYIEEFNGEVFTLRDESGEEKGWDYGRRLLLDSYKRHRSRRLVPDNPILSQTDSLGLKAAVEYARERGISKLIIDDAETAMMTEGHDKYQNAYLEPTENNISRMIDEYEPARDVKKLKSGKRIDLGGRTLTVDNWIEEGFDITLEIPRIKGMTRAYNDILPQLMRKMTGDKGVRVNMGEHKNAFVEGSLRDDLFFKNPDGSPKTESTGIMYDLGVPQKRREAGEPFTVSNERYQPLAEDRIHADMAAVGQAQRGYPESFGVNSQTEFPQYVYQSIGEMTYPLEHIGDLIHRLSSNDGDQFFMAYSGGGSYYGRGAAATKLKRALANEKYVRSVGGLEQALTRSIKNAFDYYKQTDFKYENEARNKSLAEMVNDGKNYIKRWAEEHNKLTPVTELQKKAQNITDAFGRLDTDAYFNRMRDLLADLEAPDWETRYYKRYENGERYQPLGPERGEYKGAKLPERERRVFGRGIFAGNVEALRRTGDPQKVEFAGAMEELYARIRNYTGQYEEGIIRPLTDLSKASQQKVVEALYDESMTRQPATAGLSPDELAAHREIRAGLLKMRNDQIAANHLIEGKPAGRDPFYFPHVVDSSIIHDLSNNPESPRAKEAERQFIDFNAELFRNNGIAPAVALQRATEAFSKFIGSLKPISVDSGFDYGAVSMPAGTKLPPTWVAADPVDGFRSYIKRFSRARAFYDVIGRDENAMRQIGRKFYYDAAGKEAAVTNPGSRLQRDPNVRALLENALGITHESQEGITPAIGRLANSLLLGNVATRLTDAATTPFKALAYLPPRYIPGLLTNMRNLRSSIDNAYKTGGVRRGDMMVVREVLGAGDRYVKGMDKVAETITKYTGSEALEKGARFLAQNVGEYIYDVNKMLADRGDKRATDFLNRVTPKWRTLAREETAQRIARLFQGSYDATNLPIWIANSPAAPFFSMMKWNIEQWNNFKRFAWEPALKGDPYALMATVLGGVAGGIAVGELREKITGKKQRVATAGELNFGFREGDRARASMEAMRKAAFLSQVTGTFGIVGELSLQAIDVASKDKPQGFSWPAYEFVSNVIGKIANAVPAAIERPEDALLITGTAANDLAKDIVAQYRILWNAVDRTKGSGEVAEANRRRDLRMSEKLRGEPTRFSPFIERDYRNERERQFDKARDRQQAIEIAKQLDARARRESTTGEEYKEARWKFRTSRIVGIPSRENNPQQFYRHLQFVRDTQGAEAADQLARDYVMLRTEQKWKSSMFR